MTKVYLGGAFAMFSKDEVSTRQQAMQVLLPKEWEFLHPLHLDAYGEGFMQKHPKVLGKRDMFMVQQADILILDALEASRVSGGLYVEIGWASLLHKPAILIAEEKNPYIHAMAETFLTATCRTREDAAHVAKLLMGHAA